MAGGTINVKVVSFSSMHSYFLNTGEWSQGKKKPFKYNAYLTKKLGLPSPFSEEDRYVPAMPNVQDNGKPNLRKLGQLPTLLIKLDRCEEFFVEVKLGPHFGSKYPRTLIDCL